MVAKFCAFVLLALWALPTDVTAEECKAQRVINLRVSAYHILSWEVSEDEVCEINQFLVYLYQRDKPIQYTFETDIPEVDVSFLEPCEEWVFSVVAVSNHTRGQEHRLYGVIPLPTRAELTIAYLNITRSGVTGDLHLTWDLDEPKFTKCDLRYRVTIEEGGSSDITDLYMTERSVNIHFLSPCTTYQFGVRAINIAHPTIEGPLKTIIYEYPATRQLGPHLVDVNANATGFNMTWAVQSRVRNNCQVLSFHIDGADHFDFTVLINDTVNRPPTEITVGSLKPSSMYYFRAYVLNIVGWSLPTVLAVQTLDVSPDGVN